MSDMTGKIIMDTQELPENGDSGLPTGTEANHEDKTEVLQGTPSDLSVLEVKEEQENEESKATLVVSDAVSAVNDALSSDSEDVPPGAEPLLDVEQVAGQGITDGESQVTLPASPQSEESPESTPAVVDGFEGGSRVLQETPGEIGPSSGLEEEQPLIVDAENESCASPVFAEEIVESAVEKKVDPESSTVEEAAIDGVSMPLADEVVSSEVVISPDDMSTGRSREVSDIFARTQDSWNAEQAVSKGEVSDHVLQSVFDLSEKVSLLSTTTAAMTVTLQKIADETEQMVGWSQDLKVTSALSKGFLFLALLVLILLLGGMSYLAVGQYNAQHNMHVAEVAVAEAIKVQQRQIAEYDKHFANLVGDELKKEREASSKASVHDRINRLRNGVAEQSLHRKNNGDWFIATGKNELSITDPEVIEELNQAFVKSGRALAVPYLVPPHKMVVALRPNGKGGTDIVVTKEVVP
jgi:hypothetical protein